MRGLRTHEGDKFEAFFALVQQEATKRHSVFFLDCGEGHEYFREDMEGEDLRGWLIPENQADRFEFAWQNDLSESQWGEWEDFIEWVVWHPPLEKLTVSFEKYI